MVFTNDDYLPSYEELTVPEITMSAAPLRAGAIYFGKYCDEVSKEYMLCSKEEKDPRKCLREGKAVTACGVDFYNKVRDNCAQIFTKYWQCLDYSEDDMNHRRCLKTQAAFAECVKDKLNIEQPELGYFSKVRVHRTDRPRPYHDLQLPDPIPDAPRQIEGHPLAEQAKKQARFGNNTFF